MNNNSFDAMLNHFRSADVEEKIEMYVSAEGLNLDQYKQLLRLFPTSDLFKLESALV